MDSSSTKLFLRHGSIEIYKSILQRTLSVGTCISCKVHSYTDLANSIYYCLTQKVSDSEFVFKVLKRSYSHFFQLHCDMKDCMTFRVMYYEDDLSVVIPNEQTEYGYWVEVPNEIVYDPRNKFLHEENSLVVQFYYDWSRSFSRSPFALCGTRTLRDEELFSQDMLRLYDIRNSTGDFLIKVQGEQFIVHKFIFDARAMWFKRNPKSFSWKQISIIGEPLVMNKVVRYMYSGVLEETDYVDMLQMLDIAVTLEMMGLIQTISSILIKMLTKDNALSLFKKAKALGMDEIAGFAQPYLKEGESWTEEKRRGRKNSKKKRR